MAAWRDGSARYDFVMDEQTLAISPSKAVTDGKEAGNPGSVRCILVVPKKPASGSPWSWRDLHRNHQPPTGTELLARGFISPTSRPGRPGSGMRGSLS